MSEIESYVNEALETTLAPQMQKLEAGMRHAGEVLVAAADVGRGLVAADALPTGLVVSDDTMAMEVVGLVAQVIAAENVIAAGTRSVMIIPKTMEGCFREAVRPTLERLAAAKKAGNDARIAWQTELRRRAAAEALKAQQEAAAAHAAAAKRGEDVPPAETAAPVAPRIVKSGASASYMQVRVNPVRIVDQFNVPAEWITLNEGAARADFTAAVKAKLAKKPEPGERTIYKGVEFEAVESAVNR